MREKKEAIKRFLDYCKSNSATGRMLTAMEQFNQDTWEIDDNLGRIRISHNKDRRPEYSLTCWFFSRGAFGCEISNLEYREMKQAYMGNYDPNLEITINHKNPQ